MRAVPERAARMPDEGKRILTLASQEFSISGVLRTTGTVATSTWSSANKPLAFPFRMSYTAIVDRLGWMNGSSAGGGVDVGIYDEAWNRIVSTGGTTGSGNSAWQFVDVADTTITGGLLYYLVMARDNTTANRPMRHVQTIDINVLKLGGAMDSATNAYPLPDPLTNMVSVATVNIVPVMGIGMRGPF